MKNIFCFGEKVKGYSVRVLNERETRAGAGILFVFALISAMHVLLIKNHFFINLFIKTIYIDFVIRLFINPKYSPILILGRFFVQNQKVEYSGAAQKKFAWSIGFFLATIMMYLVVVSGVRTPLNLYICLLCMVLMFFESAFGICIGCLIYNFFNKEKAKLCPGNTCESFNREEIQKIKFKDILILVTFMIIVFLLY